MNTDGKCEHDTMVPGDADDMAEALAEIASALGCQNTLDDILHAIAALASAQASVDEASIVNVLHHWMDMASARVAAKQVLDALGHSPKVSGDCTARVVPLPPEKRPPGSGNPPIFCCLKAGHEGPHHCNHGGMTFPPFPFRASDEVEFREPITVCTKCGTRWPCPDAQKVTAALATAASHKAVEADALTRAARDCLPFVAYAYDKGIAGAEDAGRALETALAGWFQERAT